MLKILKCFCCCNGDVENLDIYLFWNNAINKLYWELNDEPDSPDSKFFEVDELVFQNLKKIELFSRYVMLTLEKNKKKNNPENRNKNNKNEHYSI